MLNHNVEQGSAEWRQLRLGIPTASEFDRIITPSGKASTQDEAYANKLLAEIITGSPIDEFEGNSWTDRGKELEADAVAFYELQKNLNTSPVGFVTDDARSMGTSPDRLVGEDGLLEIKCPAPHTHVQYLLNNTIDRKYYPQVQGQLLVTGRKWVDWLSYHPEMPPVIIRVERDGFYLDSMNMLLFAFWKKLKDKRAILTKMGHIAESYPGADPDERMTVMDEIAEREEAFREPSPASAFMDKVRKAGGNA